MSLRKTILVLAGFLAFSTAAFSQRDFKKHEISLGFSPYPVDPLYWTEFYFSETGVLENVYGERIGSRNTIPLFSVSYNHFFKRWFSLDTRLSFSGAYRNVYCGIESKYDHRGFDPYVTLMEMARFTYLNRDWVRLYSSVGLGLTTYDGLYLSLQTTLLGVSVGKKFFGFAEFGVGAEYLPFHCGLGYRF